ncbi:MAG TPA: hypothetical protein VFY21_12175 [Xanthobacteraceae bacterium]|nr:hypothetical protein [Xanthobacteraceae bacterium]
MRAIRNAALLSLTAILLASCGGGSFSTRKDIEGNNTGGVIPPAAAKGKDPQQLADAHCAKYGNRARITFSGAEAGGDVVFVCETASGPAMMATQPPAKAAPAASTKQTPAKR